MVLAYAFSCTAHNFVCECNWIQFFVPFHEQERAECIGTMAILLWTESCKTSFAFWPILAYDIPHVTFLGLYFLKLVNLLNAD